MASQVDNGSKAHIYTPLLSLLAVGLIFVSLLITHPGYIAKIQNPKPINKLSKTFPKSVPYSIRKDFQSFSTDVGAVYQTANAWVNANWCQGFLPSTTPTFLATDKTIFSSPALSQNASQILTEATDLTHPPTSLENTSFLKASGGFSLPRFCTVGFYSTSIKIHNQAMGATIYSAQVNKGKFQQSFEQPNAVTVPFGVEMDVEQVSTSTGKEVTKYAHIFAVLSLSGHLNAAGTHFYLDAANPTVLAWEYTPTENTTPLYIASNEVSLPNGLTIN